MIQVLFFASLREQLNTSSLSIALSDPTPLTTIVEQLGTTIENWQLVTANTSLLFAVNQEMVTLDSIVHPGDEVAIFPPVTGG